MKRNGFTLIELLIVIAIILILISIALPNFLEAQIRARVVNSVAEMRSLETAIMSYALDHKRNMGDNMEIGGSETAAGGKYVYSQLTTPTAYVKSIPLDEFNSADRAVDGAGQGAATLDARNNVYRYHGACWRCKAAYNPNNQCGKRSEVCDMKGGHGVINGYPFDPRIAFAGNWIVVSPGPDRSYFYGEWIMYKPEIQMNGNSRIYSPTNGTVSSGDLAEYNY